MGQLNTAAVIQARMGSSRLPNKMLFHLHGYSVIEWVYFRVKQSKLVDQILFALTDIEQDDVLAKFVESLGANVFRGSETDLVERYVKASRSVSADKVVRICADNPFICASEIDKLISYFKQNTCHYAYNHIPKNNCYPDGLGAEICSHNLLEEIHKKAISSEHREHLFNYIWDNQNDYIIKTFNPDKEIAHPELKLDLDTINDFKNLLEKPYRIEMNAKDIVKTSLMDVPKENSEL